MIVILTLDIATFLAMMSPQITGEGVYSVPPTSSSESSSSSSSLGE